MSDFDNERYSVCIAHAEKSSSKTYYKYFRIADYYPEENPDELIPAIVQMHALSLEESQENPDYLYTPIASRNYEKRDSDFYLFKWHLDPYDWSKPVVHCIYDDVNLLAYNEAREVIILEGKRGEQGLREALAEGIPFKGKTTSVFYIVYDDENDEGLCPAIRCERRSLLFSDDMIKLRYGVSNTKETVLSAPRVWLNVQDIIDSLHEQVLDRKLYARLDEPESDGGVLLRSLDYYASDYVKWFIREESIQLSKSNRQVISQIIDSALSIPEALEIYLDAGASEGEVESLRKSIARLIMDKDDPTRELVRNALLEDKGFYRECVEQVMEQSDVLLEERKTELETAKSEIASAESSMAKMKADINSLTEERQSLRDEIEHITSDYESARKEQEKALEEIQSNAALKLGLKVIAAQQPVAVQTSAAMLSGIKVEDGPSYDYVKADSFFEEALVINMKKLGIMSIVGKSENERRKFAIGLLSALPFTKFFAIPHSVAHQIGDAISVAISGCGAKRIIVPTDCRDVAAVLESIHEDDEVVIIEGVVDAVNEGILFPLLSREVKPIVILSFMSHASASLVAKEAWGEMFLPNVESLSACPLPLKDVKLERATLEPELPKVCADDMFEEVHDLVNELGKLNLGAGSLMLAASVLRAVEDITEEDDIECYITQHLFMSSRCDEQAFGIIDAWYDVIDNDSGLLELAKKLGVYEL